MGILTFVSLGIICWILGGRDLRYLEGYLIPVIIFVLAVFAASPAVLLILGRPLTGIDQFMPSGEAKLPEKAEAKKDEKVEKAAD